MLKNSAGPAARALGLPSQLAGAVGVGGSPAEDEKHVLQSIGVNNVHKTIPCKIASKYLETNSMRHTVTLCLGIVFQMFLYWPVAPYM